MYLDSIQKTNHSAGGTDGIYGTNQKSMRNAEVSLNIENLYVSDKAKELCFRLLNKEITFDEYPAAIKMKAANR